MANWDLRRLQMHLQKHQALPVYLLIGDEPFLVEEALAGIRSIALEGGATDFNSDTFYGADDDAVKVRDTVEMLPMMSPKRLVILRQAHRLKDKDWEVLTPILEKPVESTVFVVVAEKVDKRKKYFKRLEDIGGIVELPRPYENQLGPWIDYISSKLGVKLAAESAMLLRQFVGASLTEIYREISKLRDFVANDTSGGGEIAPDVVLKVVSRVRSESVFELTNAIGRRDRVAALNSLAGLLGQGQNEIGALTMISRHFRILSQVRDGARLGVPAAQLAVKVGVPQFFLKDYQSQARLWSDEQIGRTVHALKETDKALKSSPISSHIWLENFILKTCGAI